MKRIRINRTAIILSLILCCHFCGAQGVKVTFLGTGHGRASAARMNSCTLIQGGGKTYLVDACDGAASAIMKSGTHVTGIDAIFITHDHLDHCWGLPFLLEQIISWNDCKEPWHSRNLSRKYPVLLSSQMLADALELISRTAGIPQRPNIKCKVYGEGVIFSDGNVTVTAVGNDHSPRLKDGSFTSYSFLFEFASGEKIFFSGDLNKAFDLSTETIEAAGGVDLLVCELVHYDPALAVEKFQTLKADRIVFTHYDDKWEGKEGRKLFRGFSKQYSIPSRLAKDGDSVTIDTKHRRIVSE